MESDVLHGSFFTHALVSGLLGAADKNGDGAIVLDEAYSYAYEATLRATSRTFAGTQHPTFQYELRGQGAVVLTRLSAARAGRGRLTFSPGIGFLVFADSADGAVLAELGPQDSSRKLSLPSGRLFLRGRGADFLLEGTAMAKAGQDLAVDPSGLVRVEYARLVRKGHHERAYAHGPVLGPMMRTRLPNADGLCLGGFAGYRLESARLGIAARLSACTSGFRNPALAATTREYAISVGPEHTWDFPWVSLTAGVGIGVTLTHQHFETLAVAPDRLSTAPMGFLSAAVIRSISRRFYVGLDVRGEGHLLQLQQSAADRPQLRAAFAWRISPALGLEF